MALPARAETQADDPAVRERAERITRRAADGIIDQVAELGDLGLVRSTTVEVRMHRASPHGPFVTGRVSGPNGMEDPNRPSTRRWWAACR
ncbi:hypothetical protein GCM10020358_23680 [Amorphoplanes nipponensis]|uniref:Uncharacterized protein n=1 Tax=Actinoplanes nipponensis TaxID=135950 RepID=A0A919MHG2_9ACTN|nr:hypothetical protein Ani05nite_31730 [Actinoplanes nipponensis]